MTYVDITATVRDMSGLPPEPLRLPLRGHSYTFPAIPADPAVAAKLRIVEANHWAAQRGGLPHNDVVPDDPRLINALLADQRPAMVANGITEAEHNHVVITVLMFYLFGPGMAELYWNGGLEALRDAAASIDHPTPTRKVE